MTFKIVRYNPNSRDNPYHEVHSEDRVYLINVNKIERDLNFTNGVLRVVNDLGDGRLRVTEVTDERIRTDVLSKVVEFERKSGRTVPSTFPWDHYPDFATD